MARISFVQGKGSLMHNRRAYAQYGKSLPGNIDPNKVQDNLVLVNHNLKELYEELFGDALTAYNAKQKKECRKIQNYYDHVKKSKNGEKLFHEVVIQWGSMEDFLTNDKKEKAVSVLRSYVGNFEERNPHLKIVGAYIHLDEASPHLHLDFIPIATGYKNGLSVRNSMSKALTQQGIIASKTRKDNVMNAWRIQERDYLHSLCVVQGLEVEQEMPSNRRTMTVDEYKTQVAIVDHMVDKNAPEPYYRLSKLHRDQVLMDVDTFSSLKDQAAISKTKHDIERKLIEEEKKNIDETKAFLRHRERIVSKSEEQNERMAQDILNRYSELETIEKRAMDMYQSQKTLNDDYGVAINELQATQKALMETRKRYLEIEQNYEMMAKQKDNMESIVIRLSSENSKLKEDAKKNEHNVLKYNEVVDSVNRLKSENERLKAINNRLLIQQQDYDRLEEQAKKAELYRAKASELDYMKSSLDDTQRSYHRAIQDKNALQQELYELQERSDSYQRQLNQQQTELENVKKVNIDLKSKISHLQEDFEEKTYKYTKIVKNLVEGLKMAFKVILYIGNNVKERRYWNMDELQDDIYATSRELLNNTEDILDDDMVQSIADVPIADIKDMVRGLERSKSMKL